MATVGAVAGGREERGMSTGRGAEWMAEEDVERG